MTRETREDLERQKAEIERKLEDLDNEALPLVWCDIPAGEVEIKDEIREVSAFRCAKYPVTNAQFNQFLEDPEGYHNPAWWEGFQNKKGQPKDPSWTEPNCPRERVNWYEATAYCRWLSAQLGYTVRLLTEAEWQHAATGGNKDNRYPWGSDPDDTRCNIYDSGIGRTTPVDKYPGGQTEQGVYDMVGNVWEWCSDTYE